jgi:hypothetical protein
VTKEKFQYYLKHPGQLNEQTLDGLKEIVADYPWFTAARMLYLRNLLNIGSYRFEVELEANSIFITDRVRLFKLLNEASQDDQEFQLLPYDKEAFSRFFNNEKGLVSNVDTMGSAGYELPKAKTLSGAVQISEEPDLIDKFIAENPTIASRRTIEKPEKGSSVVKEYRFDDGLITENIGRYLCETGLVRRCFKSL